MARFQIKPREDGRGPYRWSPVVRTPKGLAVGTIYDKQGDDLTTAEALELRRHCARANYQVRRACS